jgi:hypothetical protein
MSRMRRPAEAGLPAHGGFLLDPGCCANEGTQSTFLGCGAAQQSMSTPMGQSRGMQERWVFGPFWLTSQSEKQSL